MSQHLLIRGDARKIPLADGSVDLVLGSPPYVDARLYLESGRNLGISRGCAEWVEWMLGVTKEAVRVSRGLVLWVCAGVTRDWCYLPACEGLKWEWWKRGGNCWRPCYWHRVGIPGSGGAKWLRADVEYVLAFTGGGHDFWTHNTEMGRPPKWAPGGKMTNRMKDGKRVYERNWKLNQVNHPRQSYTEPDVTNPGTYHTWDFVDAEAAWHESAFVHTNAGGGHLGSELAHENEAPFPEALAEFFVRSFCPPGGLVLDTFSGSGTTVATALKNDRRAIGLDLRMSQCHLGQRRIADSLRPVSRLDPARTRPPLVGQLDLFAEAAP